MGGEKCSCRNTMARHICTYATYKLLVSWYLQFRVDKRLEPGIPSSAMAKIGLGRGRVSWVTPNTCDPGTGIELPPQYASVRGAERFRGQRSFARLSGCGHGPARLIPAAS